MRLSEFVRPDASLEIDGFFEILAQCSVETKEKTLTFLEDLKYLKYINENPSIGCVICRPEHVQLIKNKSIGILCVKQPRLYFFEIHNEIVEKDNCLEQKFKTVIGNNSKISSLAHIASNNVIIGNDVIIEEFVTIKENVKIGNKCIIRPGCVIGGQGFEFKRNKECSILTVQHAGWTVIGDNVEIKELCTIHQAVFKWDSTQIGDYSKLDAQSHIGHSTKIGKRVMIGSHANLAGNILVEDDTYIGPGVTISNRLNIMKRSKVNIGSVVTKDVFENQSVTGNFAIDHKIFIEDLKRKVKTTVN